MSPSADNDDAANPGREKPASDVRTIRIIAGRIESSDLFVGTREIIIGHGADIYRMRLTALNKLILTK